VELGAFTVLVGPNDSGKSCVLDAIRLLGRTTDGPIADALGGGLPEPAPTDALLWRGDASQRIVLDILAKTPGELSYRVELHANGRVHGEMLSSSSGHSLEASDKTGPSFELNVPPTNARMRQRDDSTALRSAILAHAAEMPDLVELAEAFGSSAKYQFDIRALRRPSPPATTPVLSPSGDNLAAVLDDLLTGPDRGAAHALEASLREAFPMFAGIALRTVAIEAGRVLKALELPLSGTGRNKPVGIPAAYASEGALLMTAFLALAYGNSPEILLLEEPAAGLHPSRIPMLVNLLRQISAGEVGSRPRQVILTTHSPILLNCVKPDEVRIVHRDPKQGTSITPMAKIANIDTLLFGHGVGDIWAKLSEDDFLMQREAPPVPTI
jgi:predicted ATPase